MRMLSSMAALCLALGATGARADIYVFIDSEGVTHFSNVPADDRYKVLLVANEDAPAAGAKERNPVNAALLARAEEYSPIIEEAARTSDVDPQLLRAVIVVESGFDERAVSRRGARGLMQLMPLTARRFGARDAFNPRQNIRAGARYLRELIDRYENNVELVLAAYNAGEEAVDRYGRTIPPFAETRAYVPRVLHVYTTLRNLTEST
jgi:soluble lytic murein transglycosylase-like protein